MTFRSGTSEPEIKLIHDDLRPASDRECRLDLAKLYGYLLGFGKFSLPCRDQRLRSFHALAMFSDQFSDCARFA